MSLNIIKHIDLKPTERQVREGTWQMLRLGLIDIRDSVRAQIPDSRYGNRSSGWNQNIPGAGRRGSLRAAVHYRRNKRTRYNMRGSVYVSPYSPAYVYAFIHEFGGDIYPVRARMLRFVIDGQVIFAHKVTIKRKMYFFHGIARGHRRMRQILPIRWWGAMNLA